MTRVRRSEKSLTVQRITRPDAKLLEQLRDLDFEAFDDMGLRVYDLAVMAEAGMVLTASAGGELVGGCQLIRMLDEPGFFFIVGFYIRPDWQGRRLGGTLLAAVAEETRQLGAEGLMLTVSPDNRRAVGLYERAGFVTEAYLEDFYGSGEHRRLLRWRFAEAGLRGSV